MDASSLDITILYDSDRDVDRFHLHDGASRTGGSADSQMIEPE